MAVMVPGLILAAGGSTRMGRPKALLPCGDSGLPFVASLILALVEGGVADVLVVGRPDDTVLRLEVETRLGRFVENPRPDDGQLSSLVAGLNVADRPGVRGLLVTPVDVPLVTGAIVATLMREFHTFAAPIVRAVHRGRHGHPVIFSRTVFDELRRADPGVGAKAVVHAHERDLRDVEVGSEGVLTDVDTPEDYEGLFGKVR
jgi:molybdenum cofactor cytidylyltransferase